MSKSIRFVLFAGRTFAGQTFAGQTFAGRKFSGTSTNLSSVKKLKIADMWHLTVGHLPVNHTRTRDLLKKNLCWKLLTCVICLSDVCPSDIYRYTSQTWVLLKKRKIADMWHLTVGHLPVNQTRTWDMLKSWILLICVIWRLDIWRSDICRYRRYQLHCLCLRHSGGCRWYCGLHQEGVHSIMSGVMGLVFGGLRLIYVQQPQQLLPSGTLWQEECLQKTS